MCKGCAKCVLYSVSQCFAVRCSVLQCTSFFSGVQGRAKSVLYSVTQCVAVRCSVLQCAAVCCSVLQCVAVFFCLFSGV